jgi:hypothetical protein
MPTASAEQPATPLVARVATFFSAYPEPIGLPDGSYFCVAMRSPVRGFSPKIALHLKENEPPAWLAPELAGSLVASVRFHRGQRERNIFADAYANVMPVVRAVGGHSFPSLDTGPDGGLIENEFGNSEDEKISSYTVVEMTTQLVTPKRDFWEACAPGNTVMGPTLTRCIEALILVVNAYRFAGKIMIPAPARERLGPVVIAATRAANPEEGGWDAPVHDVFNAFAANSGLTLPETESPATTAGMNNVIFLETLGHPIIPLMQLQMDLDNAFYHDGNFRATVIFAHSASEVLMDTAILGMLFEEGRSPEEGSRIFDKPLKTRILTEFHERVGGSWNATGTKPVARWLRDLLQVRHRVAHAGYAPSYDEARVARDAHFDLGVHLRDRLAVRLRKYPLTAGMLVTRGGFDRRDIHTKAAGYAVNLAQSEALQEFLNWRAEAIRRRA